MLKIPGLERRILVMPLVGLVFYYVIQVCYQKDWMIMCPVSIFKSLDVSNNKNVSNDDRAEIELRIAKDCRRTTQERFKRWNDHFIFLTRLLTFLLGFYISSIVSRWNTQVGWNQFWKFIKHDVFKVNNIPDAESPQLMLGGLVRSDPTAPRHSLTSPGSVLEARKMIARYCVLSWTLCFNTFSTPIRLRFGTARKLVAKGLLRERELRALQVTEIGFNGVISFIRFLPARTTMTKVSRTGGGCLWPGRSTWSTRWDRALLRSR